MRCVMYLMVAVAASVVTSFAQAEESANQGWFSKERPVVVVRAFYQDRVMLQNLVSEKAPWSVNSEKSYAVVEINEFDYVELIKDGFVIELDQRRTAELHTKHQRLPNQRAGIDGFACYRTVDETYADAQQLTVDYPDLAQWIDIGDSWEKENGLGGHDLRVLKITNSSITGSKPKLFSMSAIHAREYTTAETNTRFAEYLLQNYATNADARWLVDHHELHFSLQSNPDGREKAQTGISWRKNTNQNYCSPTSNSRGADLNRNFEFGWGCCGGSSGNQCSGTYRGASPGSEPEVEAIQNYLLANFDDNRGPNLSDAAPSDAPGVFLDIHSFSQLVLWPWGNTFDPSPNDTGLVTLGRKFAYFNDYTPQQATQLYITDGTTDDFAYGELGLAAYTFELGTSFFQDCGSFESTIYPDNLKALIYAAKTARAPYMLPAGPDVLNIQFDSNTVLPGTQVNVSASADDTRFNNSNGNEPSQNISSANAYIDIPPWAPGATALGLSASDGSFNNAQESLSLVLDTSGLANGEHIVYLQATDSLGNAGVVSAEFLYIVDPAVSPVISGVVTAADNAQGLAATVQAGSFQTTTDPATGAYQLFVVAGDYTITATPVDSGYGSSSVNAVTASNGETTTINFALFPFCDVFEDDAENAGIAWTTTGNWARTQEIANSPTYSWTDSPGGEYTNNQNVSLTSPPFDLSGTSAAELSFAQICDTEATYDFCVVEVSANGVNWTELARYDQTSGAAWNVRTMDASAIAGSVSARIRFRMTTDISVTEDGWHVDDIKIRAAGAQCVANVDTDGDGISDNIDNCTLVSNTAQADSDNDGYGNRCDADFNNDGIANFGDLSIFASNFLNAGILITDINTDGVTNFGDLSLFSQMFLLPPGPSGQVSD